MWEITQHYWALQYHQDFSVIVCLLWRVAVEVRWHKDYWLMASLQGVTGSEHSPNYNSFRSSNKYMGRHWAANGCPPLCGYAMSEERSTCRPWNSTYHILAPKQINSVSSQDIGSFYWAPPAAISGAWSYCVFFFFSASLLQLKKHKSILWS